MGRELAWALVALAAAWAVAFAIGWGEATHRTDLREGALLLLVVLPVAAAAATVRPARPAVPWRHGLRVGLAFPWPLVAWVSVELSQEDCSGSRFLCFDAGLIPLVALAGLFMAAMSAGLAAGACWLAGPRA